jgi:ABC-type Fe3+-citrate transport system substrate-binding protein
MHVPLSLFFFVSLQISNMKTVATTAHNPEPMNARIKLHEQTLQELTREVQQARYRDNNVTSARNELFKRETNDPLDVHSLKTH